MSQRDTGKNVGKEAGYQSIKKSFTKFLVQTIAATYSMIPST